MFRGSRRREDRGGSHVLLRALPLVVLSTACGRIWYEVLDDSASAGSNFAGAPSRGGVAGSQLVGAGGETVVGRGGAAGGQTTAYGGSPSGGSGGRAGGSSQEQGGVAGGISSTGASGQGPAGGWGGAGGSIMAGGAPVAGGAGAEGGAPVATGGHSGGADPVGAAGAGGLSGSAGVAGSGGSGGSPETGGAGPGGASSGGTGASAGASSLGDCRTETYGGNEYLFCASEVAWSEASDGCASVGMHLVRIDNADENQWIFDSIYDTGATARGIWIGASDQVVEGDWCWTDGTLFWRGDSGGAPQEGLFNAWYASAPSKSANADCAAIDSNNGSTSWYATGCGMLAVFVCES